MEKPLVKVKYPKTIYVRREKDRNSDSTYLEALGATPEECAEVGQEVTAAVYEFKGLVKITTDVKVEK